MIKCKEALYSDLPCNNGICCYECDDYNECEIACELFNADSDDDYKRCEYTVKEETDND